MSQAAEPEPQEWPNNDFEEEQKGSNANKDE